MKEEFGRRTTRWRLKLNLKKRGPAGSRGTLLGKLGGEKDRWSEQAASIDVALKALPLNCCSRRGSSRTSPRREDRAGRRRVDRAWPPALRLAAYVQRARC